MCCASRFWTDGGGVAGSRPSNVQGPVKQNASPGEQSEGPRPRWKPGQEQNPGPENQDSQHMLEQPRGSFPDMQRSTNSAQLADSVTLGPIAFQGTFPARHRWHQRVRVARLHNESAPKTGSSKKKSIREAQMSIEFRSQNFVSPPPWKGTKLRKSVQNE